MTTQELLACTDRYHGKSAEGATGVICTDPDCPAAPCVAWRAKQSEAAPVANPPLQIDAVRTRIIAPTPAEVTEVTQSAGRGPSALVQLKADMEANYSGFDWAAMELCLAAILAHYAAKETQAIWPFIVGAPRTGKTEAVIRAFDALPAAYSAGDLTPKALMSANDRKGLLQTLSEKGQSIVLFKDFTSMLGKRIEDAAEVMAVLREIADGNYARWTGNGEVPPWQGKLTIIAGVTPQIEKHRAVIEVLGPRFLFIRWATPPARDVARQAILQINHEMAIREESQRLVRAILAPRGLHLAELLPDHLEAIVNYCVGFTKLRQPVDRDFKHHYIERVQDEEGAGAIAKHLNLIARSRAALWGRSVTNDEDLALARRVAMDALPQGRLAVYRHLLAGVTDVPELAVLSRMDFPAVRSILTEFRAIGLVSWEDGVKGSLNLQVGDFPTQWLMGKT